MSIAARACLTGLVFLAAGQGPAPGQVRDELRPLEAEPPLTKKDLDRREALKLYTIGLVCQREDRLLEALRTFERALELDADAASVYKALVPLYLAVERDADALAACGKAAQLDPESFETWFIYGRQLRAVGRVKEAIAAFARGVGCSALKKRPELAQQMYFELGALHEEDREYAKAASAFAETARILDRPEVVTGIGSFPKEEVDARLADLYERLGRLYTRQRKYEEAIASFKKAQSKARVRSGRLSYNLAEVYRAQGRPKEALASLDPYLQLQPQGMEGYEMKIALLRELKREDDVVPALEGHLGKDRYNAALKLLLARELAAAGKAQRAEAAYLELAKGTPSAEIYRGLFTLYKDTPRWGMDRVLRLLDGTLARTGQKVLGAERLAATATARTVLGVLRDDPALVKPLLDEAQRQTREGVKLAYETRHFLAVLAAHARQMEAAETYYRQCLDKVTPENEAAIYGGLLKVLWQARKYNAIVETCREGLKKTQSTNHVLFHLDLAQALPFLGKGEEAVAHADKAVALAAGDARLFVRLRRVAVLTRVEKHKRAIAEGEAMIKEYKQPADTHDIRYALSNAYTAAHIYSKAEETLERLIKDYPDDATAYNDLGYILADRSKSLKKAEEYIRKAIELDRKQKKSGAAVGTEEEKDNAAYMDSLGWVLFRRGQMEAARSELDKASHLPGGDDDPVVLDHLGEVYRRLGQPARARTAWRKAVSLYEGERRRPIDDRYQEIKQKLKDLKP